MDELPSTFELTLAYLKNFALQTFKIRHCFEILGGGAGETGERKIKNRKIQVFSTVRRILVGFAKETFAKKKTRFSIKIIIFMGIWAFCRSGGPKCRFSGVSGELPVIGTSCRRLLS